MRSNYHAKRKTNPQSLRSFPEVLRLPHVHQRAIRRIRAAQIGESLQQALGVRVLTSNQAFRRLSPGRGTFDLNGMAHLPPVMARRDCIKPLILPNGRRCSAPKAVRWSRCWAACQFPLCYMPVTARCTNVSTAIIKNKMIAEMLHPRPAYLATPSIPPVPAKNKTT